MLTLLKQLVETALNIGGKVCKDLKKFPNF